MEKEKTIKLNKIDIFYIKGLLYTERQIKQAQLEDNNTKYIYQDSKEKAEVLKELTAIKKVLLELVKNGLLWGCYPSWIYNKLATAETIKQINIIIKELKEETKRSYTERTASKTNKNIFDIIKEFEQGRA